MSWSLRRANDTENFFAESLHDVRVLGEHVRAEGQGGSDLHLRLARTLSVPSCAAHGVTTSYRDVQCFVLDYGAV